METVYVMFEEWLAERYPVLDDIVKSRRMRYAITPKLADEIKEYCKDAYAAGAAFTPEAAGRSDEDRWIPCTERLPKQETPVLIVLRGCVRIGERRWEHPTHEESFRAFWYWDDPENDGQDWNTLDVTSWRPLPAPDSGEQAAAPEKEN